MTYLASGKINSKDANVGEQKGFRNDMDLLDSRRQSKDQEIIDNIDKNFEGMTYTYLYIYIYIYVPCYHSDFVVAQPVNIHILFTRRLSFFKSHFHITQVFPYCTPGACQAASLPASQPAWACPHLHLACMLTSVLCLLPLHAFQFQSTFTQHFILVALLSSSAWMQFNSKRIFIFFSILFTFFILSSLKYLCHAVIWAEVCIIWECEQWVV